MKLTENETDVIFGDSIPKIDVNGRTISTMEKTSKPKPYNEGGGRSLYNQLKTLSSNN